MLDRAKTAMFTGHRSQHLGGFDEDDPLNLAVKSSLGVEIDKAIKAGIEQFVSGGAIGVDQWGAELVIERGKKLIIARPFPSQHLVWPVHVQRKFLDLLSFAQVVDVSPDPYHPAKMAIRNKWMMDHSSYVIAVYRKGSQGGTANALKMIRDHFLSVVDPDDLLT